MKGVRLISITGIAISVALAMVLFFWIKGEDSQDIESLADLYNLNPRQKKLLGMLKNPNVDGFEFDEFIRTKPTEAAHALTVALKSKNYNIRRQATFFLGCIDPRFTVPALLIAFKDKDREVKKHASHLLRDISVKIRENPYKPIWEWEISGFSKIRSELISAIPDFINALQDSDIKSPAAYTLANIGSPAAPAVPALINAFQKDSDIKCASVRALGSIGPKAAASVPVLITALQQDPDDMVRDSAASALASIAPEDASILPPLISALHDEEKLVRFSAANALWRIGTKAKSAIPALTSALQDEDEDVRKAAKEALKKIQESDDK